MPSRARVAGIAHPCGADFLPVKSSLTKRSASGVVVAPSRRVGFRSNRRVPVKVVTQINVNRAHLAAGLPAVQVKRGRRVQHAESVAILGPCLVSTLNVKGKRLVLVFTESEVKVVR